MNIKFIKFVSLNSRLPFRHVLWHITDAEMKYVECECSYCNRESNVVTTVSSE